jgi:phosphoglycerate dehydrogenase-like enzyme
VRVVVAEPYLLPHRDLLISQAPPGTDFSWSGSDLADVDVYVGSVFTKEMAASASRLRLVQVAGAGTNGVDFSALPADAVCANTFQHGPSIGEYVVAALVLLARRIPEQDKALRDGRWLTPKHPGGLGHPPLWTDRPSDSLVSATSVPPPGGFCASSACARSR